MEKEGECQQNHFWNLHEQIPKRGQGEEERRKKEEKRIRKEEREEGAKKTAQTDHTLDGYENPPRAVLKHECKLLDHQPKDSWEGCREQGKRWEGIAVKTVRIDCKGREGGREGGGEVVMMERR